jgi:hypothetical protein
LWHATPAGRSLSRIAQDLCALNRVEFTPGRRPLIRLLNDTAHTRG